MLATLPAIFSSPHSGKRAGKCRFLHLYQRVMPAKFCSPGEQPGGALKAQYYQWVMAAAQNHVLRRVRLGGRHVESANPTLSNHHQKEAR